MKACRTCGKDVAESAPRCLGCGERYPAVSEKAWMLMHGGPVLFVLGLFVIFVVWGTIRGCLYGF